MNEIIQQAVSILEKGGILLIKGMGGMHLACNPYDGSGYCETPGTKKQGRETICPDGT